jgi:hypothetical protein
MPLPTARPHPTDTGLPRRSAYAQAFLSMLPTGYDSMRACGVPHPRAGLLTLLPHLATLALLRWCHALLTVVH